MVPPLNIEEDSVRRAAPMDASTAAVVRQMATELAQLKMQMSKDFKPANVLYVKLSLFYRLPVPKKFRVARPQTSLGGASIMNPLVTSAEVVVNEYAAADGLPDISTSSGGDEDFLTVHRNPATIYRKQQEAASPEGLQFLADSRSKMQNLSQEADVSLFQILLSR